MFISCHYKSSFEKDFQQAVLQLLGWVKHMDHVVRIIFFGSPSDDYEFMAQQRCITTSVIQLFQDKVPAYTFLAQPLLDGGLLGVEVQILENCTDTVWKYSHYRDVYYVQVHTAEARMLFLSGIVSSNHFASVHEQSDYVMKTISSILKVEGFATSDIVRQWNYIADITGMESQVKQRYQEFNDVRSDFYGNSFLKNGYPAATGIGTRCGGVQIELDALSDSATYSHRIDNPKQRAAYDYSSEVLVGSESKTTPKFERARSVSVSADGWMYISGTAAIRGELTLETNAREQALLTLDNIRVLLSDDVLGNAGISGKAKLKSLRVYVKQSADFDSVRNVVEEFYPNLETVYVNAGICRDNLLVEMEGSALIVGGKK